MQHISDGGGGGKGDLSKKCRHLHVLYVLFKFRRCFNPTMSNLQSEIHFTYVSPVTYYIPLHHYCDIEHDWHAGLN